MAWNTTFTRFYSGDLAGLECGSYLKIPRRERMITKVAQYTGNLEKGQCVAMLRVPTGSRIVKADLSWQHANNNTTAVILGVGDPYACARLIGPVNTAGISRGQHLGVGQLLDCGIWGLCGTMTKTGTLGDGCGIFYQYTCETDICITNLHSVGNAWQGGFPGAVAATDANIPPIGAKWTGGTLTLTVEYLQAS